MADCTYCTRKVDTDCLGYVILSNSLTLEQELTLYDGESIGVIEGADLAHSECMQQFEDVVIV